MENASQILHHHLQVCEALYHFLQEEGGFLRQMQALPPDEMIEKKRLQLAALTASVEALKGVGHGDALLQPTLSVAQKKTLKVFQLLRENEQLLLKIQSQSL
jgi:hypothetical protein